MGDSNREGDLQLTGKAKAHQSGSQVVVDLVQMEKSYVEEGQHRRTWRSLFLRGGWLSYRRKQSIWDRGGGEVRGRRDYKKCRRGT